MSTQTLANQSKITEIRRKHEIYHLLLNGYLSISDLSSMMNSMNLEENPQMESQLQMQIYVNQRLSNFNRQSTYANYPRTPMYLSQPTQYHSSLHIKLQQHQMSQQQMAFDYGLQYDLDTKPRLNHSDSNVSTYSVPAISERKETSIRILKNNKIVFAHAQYQSEKKNIPRRGPTFVNRGSRGSKYRGVSKNGNQWQVLIMVKNNKNYFGSYDTEYHAARVYDLVAIQNYESKAKTNFRYSDEEIYLIKNVKFSDKESLKKYYSRQFDNQDE